MIDHDRFSEAREARADREREDRVVAFLRSRGVFAGGRADVRDSPQAGPSPGTLPWWRVPMIAAAAAVAIGVLTLVADRLQRAEPQVVSAEAPTLLIWY